MASLPFCRVRARWNQFSFWSIALRQMIPSVIQYGMGEWGRRGVACLIVGALVRKEATDGLEHVSCRMSSDCQ